MSKNSRNSFEQKAKIKAEKGNNINIQINFNMKQKGKGITGKKIDNFVEIQQKNANQLEIKPKNTQSQKKKQKKTIQTIDRSQKQKPFETPNKYKHIQRMRNSKNFLQQQTPQKIIYQKKQERSKSANSKLVKRKNAKSMDNIKSGVKFNRNKKLSPNSSKKPSKSPSPDKSKSKSNQKSKSKSKQKSNKKLLRSHEASLKNLNFFSNSGIKNKIKKQISNSRQKIISAASKKPNHEEILKFMSQKKRKQKIEKNKRIKQEKTKKQKLTEQLKNVQIERKANASKKVIIPKVDTFGREQRLPIYYFDDDEQFNEESNYENLNNQASKLIHDSPSPKEHIQTIQISKLESHDKNSSSAKKLEKKKKITMVQKYLKGTINQTQLKYLNKKIITIQSVWRGFLARKALAKLLNDESIKIKYMRNKIQNKKGAFWNNEQNSIVHLSKDSPIKISESEHSQSNTSTFNKIPSNNNSQYHSNPANKFKKLSIQLDEDLMKNHQKQKQAKESDKMQKQIEQLKKMIEQQNSICKKLQMQNLHLKKNIKVNGSKDVKEIKNEDLANSLDYMEIRMPKKIESPHQYNLPQSINIQFSSNSDDETHNRAKYGLNSYKQQFQNYQCSSPSNAKLEQHIKNLKNTNISGLFKKKEIKVEEKYVKKYEIFDKMLNDKIFSPRTYNMKKKELQLKKKQEIQQIAKKKQEAKKVIGFFQDVIKEEQSISKEDNHEEEEFNQEQSLRTASYGLIEHNRSTNSQMSPSKEVKDSFTNTEPLEEKRQSLPKKKNMVSYERQKNDSQSSEDEQIYRKYWTDDIQQVHKHTVQITKRIDQALKSQSQSLNSKNVDDEKYRSGSSGYNSIGHQQKQQVKKLQFKGLNDIAQNQSLLQLSKPAETQAQKKARQIFNKIDLYDDESKSEEQMQNSHDKIYQLLNKPSAGAKNQPKQNENLYISQAEFNKKRKSQDLSNSVEISNVIEQKQLSRSSSFDKSKSFSANNSQAVIQGFITNLTFIKEFCISICQFIRSNQAEKTYFISCLSKPTKIDLFEYLLSHRTTIAGQIKNNYNTYYDEYLYNYFRLTALKDTPITSDLFNKFMQAFQSQQQGDQVIKNKQARTMREYFLISVIDCFNQSLQYEKPGSVYGESMPWLNTSKQLKNHAHKQLQNINHDSPSKIMNRQSDEQQVQTEEQKLLDQIFGTAIAKIIQWGSCLCGFIADPMPMEMGDSQIANLSQTQLSSIRQNRVGLMLEKWLVEQEQKITNSTGEFTEVVLNLSEKIMELIIEQVSQQFYDFGDN